MGLENYSKVPGSNADPVPNGAPEGWLGNQVNEVVRQIMADIRNVYERHDWVSFLKDVAPRGAKTVIPGAAANEITIVGCDARAYLKAGQMIRILKLGAETRLLVQTDATFGAGNTTVFTKTNRPAGPFDSDGLEIFARRQDTLPNLYWAGVGDSAARLASVHGNAPFSFAFWLNTDNVAKPTLQIGYQNVWKNLAVLDVWGTDGQSLAIGTGANAISIDTISDPTKALFSAFGNALEIRNDNDLYYNGAKLTPGESDALTLAGLTLTQVQATVRHNVRYKTADEAMPNGETLVALLTNVNFSAIASPADRVLVEIALNINASAGNTVRIRMRVGTGAGIGDALLFERTISASGGDDEFRATFWLDVPALATHFSITSEKVVGGGGFTIRGKTTPASAHGFVSLVKGATL